MSKYLVETYYTCSFKVKHYLDDITEDDLYIVGNKLFVNQKGEIYIYEFPINEYFEATDSFLNISTLPFKQYVDLMLNRTIN